MLDGVSWIQLLIQTNPKYIVEPNIISSPRGRQTYVEHQLSHCVSPGLKKWSTILTKKKEGNFSMILFFYHIQTQQSTTQKNWRDCKWYRNQWFVVVWVSLGETKEDKNSFSTYKSCLKVKTTHFIASEWNATVLISFLWIPCHSSAVNGLLEWKTGFFNLAKLSRISTVNAWNIEQNPIIIGIKQLRNQREIGYNQKQLL